MTNASKKLPEDRYKTVHIEEAMGFPSPGKRQFDKDGKYIGRRLGFVDYDTEFLGRDLLLGGADGVQQVDAADRIMGVFSRETPTLTISTVFSRFLDWAHSLADIELDPNYAPQNLMLVLSGPGIGKTHTPKVIAKALGYQHELIGSGEAGGDIDELVIAHEFKGNAAGDIFKKIEAVLSSDEESSNKSMLISKLKAKGFLENYMDEGGEERQRLNHDKIMVLPAADAESKGEARKRNAEEEQRMEANIKEVWQIARDCELDVEDKGGGIGIQKVNGRLLNKLLEVKSQYERSGKAEPVIITLDEFNRFRSFGKKLQNFWEVVGGTSKEPVKLVDAAGVTHTFTPDMLRYVYIYMTGNDPKKVPSAREIDHSMLDRIGENRVLRLADFSPADWQHRLEQQLMGIGVAMHYRCGEKKDGANYWQENPEAFTAHLLAKREQGMTAAEKLQYTPMQRAMIENWDRIHQGTGQVAEFFSDWADIYKKSDHRAELRDMISVPEISARLMIHVINDLRAPRVGSADIEDNLRARESRKKTAKTKLTQVNLGTHLAEYLKGLVDKTHPDQKSQVRQALYKSMYAHGVISKDDMIRAGYETNEMLATTGAKQLVADLLNTDPSRLYDKELQPLQAAVAEIIRQRYPDQREKSDSQLVTLKELTEAIKRAQTREEEIAKAGRPSDMAPVFRSAMVPVVRQQQGKLNLDFTSSSVIDDYMEEEQIPEALRAKLKHSIAVVKDREDALSSTLETLVGLAFASDLPAHVDGLINPHALRAYQVSVSRSVKDIAERSLAAAPEESKNIRKGNRDRMAVQLEKAITQLDPAYEGPLTLSESIREAEVLLGNAHPSGLAITALRTVGYDPQRKGEKGDFSDTLTMVSMTQPDPEDAGKRRSDVLIVGFSPIPQELRDYLQTKRNVTYVCAADSDAKERISGRLKELVAMGKQQLAVKSPNHPDLTENAKSGLVFRLEHALNTRTPDSSNSERVRPKRVEGEPMPDLFDLRIGALAEHMMDGQNLTSTTRYLQSVTRLSWQEFVAAEGSAPPSPGRAA